MDSGTDPDSRSQRTANDSAEPAAIDGEGPTNSFFDPERCARRNSKSDHTCEIEFWTGQLLSAVGSNRFHPEIEGIGRTEARRLCGTPDWEGCRQNVQQRIGSCVHQNPPGVDFGSKFRK